MKAGSKILRHPTKVLWWNPLLEEFCSPVWINSREYQLTAAELPHKADFNNGVLGECEPHRTLLRLGQNMAHFLRGKQAGIHNDLSAGLAPELFALDDV